jgi:hypothetical protein
MPREPARYGRQDLAYHGSLFRHHARPDWGLAILFWERDDKRCFQFADGQQRIFQRLFYHLLEPVEDDGPGAADTLRQLREASNRASGLETPAPEPALTAMVTLFRELHPAGFRAAPWTAAHRHPGEHARLRRHRQPALGEAAMLAECAVRLVGQGQPAAAIGELVRVLEGTDLVSTGQLRALAKATGPQLGELAEALAGLFVTSGAHKVVLQRFIAALTRILGRPPSWQLSTAPSALFAPQDQFCVAPATARRLAVRLGAKVEVPQNPHSGVYEQVRAMAVQVRGALVEADLFPHDLLDVYDLLGIVLAPKLAPRLDASHTTSKQAAEELVLFPRS